MKNSKYVVALCALAGAAAPATASVFFTFADPTDGLEVRYNAPTQQTPYGTMTYGDSFEPPPLLDFIVDASQEGGSVHHIDTNLVWSNWQVGAITTSGPITSAVVSGEFDFIDVGGGATDGQSILSGSFTTGLVIQAIGTGSIVTSTSGGLTYAIGPAFSAREPQIVGLQPWEDGTYTLTDITFDSFLTIGMEGDSYFNGFSANAAFSGTAEAVIPTPGSIGLAMLGTAGMIRRRRR
jgi:MYXO-CTERM domain-containing protein